MANLSIEQPHAWIESLHPIGKGKPRDIETGQVMQTSSPKSGENEMEFRVASGEGSVFMDFGVPVAWVGMTPDLADSLAKLLSEHAAEIRRKRDA